MNSAITAGVDGKVVGPVTISRPALQEEKCRKFCRKFLTRAEARRQTVFCIRLRRKFDYIWLRFPWQENSRSTNNSQPSFSPSDKKFRNFIVIFVGTYRSNYGKRFGTKSYSCDSSSTIYSVACRGEYLLNFNLELNQSETLFWFDPVQDSCDHNLIIYLTISLSYTRLTDEILFSVRYEPIQDVEESRRSYPFRYELFKFSRCIEFSIKKPFLSL